MQGKLEDLLFELEEQFWLRGADYHERHLADAVVMVFPGPAGVMVKDEIVRSLATQPRWTRVALEEHRVLQLGERAALITYRATAQRTGTDKRYIARASTAYVHDGRRWRLAFHQQTPL
jgi:hypothetical protein